MSGGKQSNTRHLHYMHTLANAPALPTLLQKIPNPVPQQATAFAPTAGTHHP
ncbi:MAG: hypothetical protein WBR29_08040 [Gammaproteobacteria bacterium]